MSLNVWSQPSGTSLGTIQEQVTISIALPLSNTAGLTFSVISGELPSGLYLKGSNILGSPYIVANQTTYKFCVRATNGTDISDRTFTIDVLGFNPPTFVTPAGYLPLGPNNQLYTADQTYISYQLEVTDLNLSLGNNLTFSILSGDGELPPGLTLSPSGLISGYIAPAPVVSVNANDGSFDNSKFDETAYDFGLVPTNGYDSYAYDDVIFDYFTPTRVTQTLSLNYQFRVTVTDGLNYTQRVFKIFVAGTDEFRADSTTPDGKADGFTADSSYVRPPVWLTKSNLGVFRANNYLTIPVALYNNYNVVFRLDTVNHDIYAVAYQISSTDNIIGDGTVASTITIERASGVPKVGQFLTFNYYVSNATEEKYKITDVETLSDTRYRLTINKPLLINIPNNTAFYIGSESLLPSGVKFDPDTGNIFGSVPYQPIVTEQFIITIVASRPGDIADELVSASRTFSFIILGSVNSIITWNTNSDLGVVEADYICTASINATTSITNAVVNYRLVSGALPPGITLTSDGELTGVVNQYANIVSVSSVSSYGTTATLKFSTQKFIIFKPGSTIVVSGVTPTGYNGTYSVIDSGPNFVMYRTTDINLGNTGFTSGTIIGSFGLLSFDRTTNNNPTTFDKDTCTFDRTYNFTIQAYDQFGYSAILRTFTIKVSTPNLGTYSNITARPFLIEDQRSSFSTFINNTKIFTPTSIYRPNDVNFGIQSNLTMLICAGIPTVDTAAYIGAMGLNVKRKRFNFGDYKSAVAYDPTTNLPVYEVVYVQMFDPLEPNGKHLPLSVRGTGLASEAITVDNSNSIWGNNPNLLSADGESAVRPDYNITIDSTGYQVSNPNTDKYYTNSITNWQTRFNAVGSSERNYLPLWMRSIQAGQKQQLGYILAVPLCFCKVGTSAKILSNIKNYSTFDFKSLDFTIDRFTITSLAGYTSDKYLVFRNDRITV